MIAFQSTDSTRQTPGARQAHKTNISALQTCRAGHDQQETDGTRHTYSAHRAHKAAFLIALALILAAAFALPATVSAKTYTKGSYKYTINKKAKTATITGYQYKKNGPAEIKIPSKLKGCKVVKIKSMSGCSMLTKVTVPTTVTIISASAFKGCYGLKEVVLPDSVKTIGDHAFSHCRNLTDFTVPKGTNSLGSALTYCTSLQRIYVDSQNYLYKADQNVLYNAPMTKLISYPGGYTSNSGYVVSGTCTTIGKYAFAGAKNLTTVTTVKGTTKIEEGAFRDCPVLASVALGPSVKTIGKEAFRNSSRINSLKIPAATTTIGEGAFRGLSDLSALTIESKDITKIGKNAFTDVRSTVLVKVPYGYTAKYKKMMQAAGLASQARFQELPESYVPEQ